MSSNEAGSAIVGTTPIEISGGAAASRPPSAPRTLSLTCACVSGALAGGASRAIHTARSALAANTSTPAGSARLSAKTRCVW